MMSLCGILASSTVRSADLVQTIEAVKPSVVAIATYQKTRSPAAVFFGTGFAVGDGLTIVTNAHVVAPQADAEKSGALGILATAATGSGDVPQFLARAKTSTPAISCWLM